MLTDYRRNGVQGQFAQQQSETADVRLGSKADIEAPPPDVRFTPKSGHSAMNRRDIERTYGRWRLPYERSQQ